jgi:hypothetical protein
VAAGLLVAVGVWAAVAPGRRRSRMVRLVVEPYRGDRATAFVLGSAFTALHSLLGVWRRVVLEIHLDRRRDGAPIVWFAVVCARGAEGSVEAVLRAAYPNVRLRAVAAGVAVVGAGVRVRRRRVPRGDAAVEGVEPAIDGLLAALAAAGAPATLRLVLRPASRLVEFACSTPEVPAGALWWGSIAAFAADRGRARSIASAVGGGAVAVVPAGRAGRAPRLRRGPLCLFRPWEVAAMWSLPSPEFASLPFMRRAVPRAPAPPRVERAGADGGLLRDEHGAVTIGVGLRRQHLAVVGAVDQGKTSVLVAGARADLARGDCAVIVLDPKGDAAEAVLSAVPRSRTVTLLDMAAPCAGFNPLAVDAPPDAVADQVVAALRGLFGEGEVRGSSDRYLRNAVIAVLACGGAATLWDVARLLEVGEAGTAFRAAVADRLVELPAYAEVARFFANELPAQLADARATTTAKLDAPANKLARVLNSPAVKRVLLNDSLRIDFDRLIARSEVLVVRGALGEIGAGNVSVLMQLLLGMLDAALSRVQDRAPSAARRAVALKVDEAPIAINDAFAQTLALKRSAGLETVACWQTDSQWEPELREQLDALFAHRILFATASAADARDGAALLMSDFSDQIRAADRQLATLASPDLRLHLPRHTAIASWTTAAGRERPFIATTIPLPLDRDTIEWHTRAQYDRGGRELPDPAPPASSIDWRAWRERLRVQSPRDAAAPARVAPAATRVDPAAARVGIAARVQSPREVTASARAAPAGRVQSPRAVAAGVPAQPPREAIAPSSLPPAPPPGLPSPHPAIAQSPPRPAATMPDQPVPVAFAELIAFDAARRWRVVASRGAEASRPPGPDDRVLLEWLVGARCALTTQIHRRFHVDRSLSVTQRHLKRLADAGVIARFQLHRDDGGGVPLCCTASDRAIGLLEIPGRRAPELIEEEMPGLRSDVHVVGWLLALEDAAGDAVIEVLGPGRAGLAPQGAGPATLELEAGLIPRDFLVTLRDGRRVEVERFAPVRPSAVVSLRDGDRGTRDLLVVLDPGGRAVATTLEAYDHLLAGWWRVVGRYRRAGGPPGLAVVCSDAGRARTVAAVADRVLTAAIAEIGVNPRAWRRPGRESIRIADEVDIHRGDLRTLAVPALPPSLRDEDGAGAVPLPLVQLPSGVTAANAKPPWR